jgi:hypothetical protein
MIDFKKVLRVHELIRCSQQVAYAAKVFITGKEKLRRWFDEII